MKKKKIIIISIIIIVLIFIISFISYKLINKNIFNEYINKISNTNIDLSNNETITGTINFKLNVTSDVNQEKIIDNINYSANYGIDLSNNFINIDLEGKKNEEKINSNIYIKDNYVYILLNDIYNKYIKYDTKYLNILNSTEDLRKVIKELPNILSEDEYYTKTETEINKKKVNKITLDLTNKDVYNELKEKIISNKELINAAENIIIYKKDDYKLKMNKLDMRRTKISLYTTKITNKFVGLDIVDDKVKIKIRYKEDKYNFEYYLRDGIMYKGYVKLKENNLDKLYFRDYLGHLIFDIDIDDVSIEYNNKIKNVELKNTISYKNLTDNDKKTIKSNNLIKDIYSKYEKREEIILEYIEIEEPIFGELPMK